MKQELKIIFKNNVNNHFFMVIFTNKENKNTLAKLFRPLNCK